MIQANEMTQSEVKEALENDKDDQFNDMHYTLTCDTCGRDVATNLLSKDFARPYFGQFLLKDVVEHNLTHYKKPTVLACEDDDIFGVVHTKCNH